MLESSKKILDKEELTTMELIDQGILIPWNKLLDSFIAEERQHLLRETVSKFNLKYPDGFAHVDVIDTYFMEET